MSNDANAYGKLFLFALALSVFAGTASAAYVTAVNLESPANGYATTNATALSFVFNFTSNNATNMSCNVILKNLSDSLNYTYGATNTNTLATITTTISGAPISDGNYTWYVNCTNFSADPIGTFQNKTSAGWNFTIDSVAPLINFSNVTNPDLFYSPNDANLSISVVLNGTGTNISFVNATLYNQTNYSLAVFTFSLANVSGVLERWNGSMNVSAMIRSWQTNGTLSSTSPVMGGLWLNLTYSDKAGNSGQAGVYTTITNISFHDLGSYQGAPAAVATCFHEGSDSTNMSNITNFYAANLLQYAELNGSAACMAQFAGISQAMPWGDAFRAVGYVNFTSVDISTQEKAQQAMSAMGSLIQMYIAPPRSFGVSRVFVNSSALTALNTTANISMYNLPFALNGSELTVLSDNGSAVTNIVWAQGAYDTLFNATVGNLTINVGHFTGYNVTDNVSPYIVVLSPGVNSNSTNRTANITVSVNGTGSEVSSVLVNITTGATSFIYKYNNQTGENSANCSQPSLGSENVSCQMIIALPAGYFSLNVSANDYATPSPGNANSTTQYFTLDDMTPVVTLNSPADGANPTNRNFSFSWTAYDDLRSNISCNLTINGTFNSTYYVLNNTRYYAYLNSTANFTDGVYNWSVNCSDDLGNNITTALRWFNLQNATQGNESNVVNTGVGGTIGATIDGNTVSNSNYTGTLTVNISSGSDVFLTFSYNFSDAWLNFSSINVTNGSSGGAVYMVVNGVNASGGQSGTKTIWLYGAGSAFNSVCVKSAENISVDSITSGCISAGEEAVPCDGSTSASGLTCTNVTATTVRVTGLRYSAVKQAYFVSGSPGTSTGSNSGGGGSSGGGVSTSSRSTEIQVDVGNNKTCTVTILRDIASASTISIVTTTLENKGGEGCTLKDFTFTDSIPDSFAAISAITFEPVYDSVQGATVKYVYPTFAPGESKTMSYAVSKWVATSKLSSFTTYTLSAAKEAAAAQPGETPLPGSDRDSHGCIPSAGYSWCEAKQKCLRTWEENCTVTQPTQPTTPTTPTTPATPTKPAAAPPQQQESGITGFLTGGAALGVFVLAVIVVIGAIAYFAMKKKKRGM